MSPAMGDRRHVDGAGAHAPARPAGKDVASRTPVVWSVAGLDSGGGAGLSADQRAADAAGVHLCPVIAAITAQNSVAVEAVHPVPPEQLAAQLDALADDLPPDAIKTGLPGSVENLRVLVDRLDRWRRRGGRPIALVVDPVLRASTGGSFADAALVAAMRDLLLPRATLVTPNRGEAARLCGATVDDDVRAVPGHARALGALGARAVCITGGDARGETVADWLEAPASVLPARGWVCGGRVAADNTHGTGCTFATASAAALARGFAVADAVVLARMLTASGLVPGASGPGRGAGAVRPRAGFVGDAALMPWVVDDEDPGAAGLGRREGAPSRGAPVSGLYAISADGHAAARLLEAGVRTVQLRLKRGAGEGDGAWRERLAGQLALARGAARRAGATLVVNDHWEAALEAGVDFVHLGQEDLAALDDPGRERLLQARRRGLRLGISSHSAWELARARAWRPDYVACGPVWPTSTKTMPWRAQGLDNLRWWVRVAGAPVVAIGGITSFSRLASAAHAGASSAALARALEGASGGDVGEWRLAWESARSAARAEASGEGEGDASGEGDEASADAGRGMPAWDGWPAPSLDAGD